MRTTTYLGLIAAAVLSACGGTPTRTDMGYLDLARPDGGGGGGTDLSGGAGDQAMGSGDLAMPPEDLAVPKDIAMPQDFAMGMDKAMPPDLAVPPDFAIPSDLTMPANAVAIQLLHLSDWHGQLDPLSVGGQEVGGAAVLSAYFQKDRLANPNSLTLTGGDEFGASPPLASFFEEEPAVKALNLMGLQYSTFGNHNFDRGIMHLQAMINRATYKYVSSNLDNLGANLQGVIAPFHVATVGGVKVGLVGITNDDAADLVFPGRLGTLKIQASAAAATAAAQMARAAGAKLVVVVVHLGASGKDMGGKPVGPLIDFATKVQGVDVILGDHTDIVVNTTVNGIIVVEQASKGATYGRLGLNVDPVTGKIVSSKVETVTPYRCVQGLGDAGCMAAVTPDPAIEMMLAPYRNDLAMANDQKIGVATATFPRGSNIERLGEVALGNLVADAIRLRYNVKAVIINGGGLRTPLPSSYLPKSMLLRRPAMGYAMGPPYDLVVGDVFAVLPFGNAVVTRTVTGTQLWAAVEHSVEYLPAAAGSFGQISGFKFTFASSKPAGSRVLSVTLNDGTAVAKNNTTYTFATADFMNAGGDGYTMFADGQGVSRDKMADVVLDYIKMLGTITPKIEGRIVDTMPAPQDGGVADLAGAPDLAKPSDLAQSGDLARPGDMALACAPKINEIQVDGPMGGSDEFVEIYNPCNVAVDLSGWKLAYRSAGNNSGGADSTMVALAKTIPPKGYHLYAGAKFSGNMALVDGTINGGMAAGGGAVGLRDPFGLRVDSASYGTLTVANDFTEGMNLAMAPASGASVGRIPDGTDSNNNSVDFKKTTAVTHKAANK